MRICPVIAPQVVTVSAVLRRPAPAMRTQTFASVLEMSIPAQRACTTSTATLPTSTSATRAFATGRAGRRTKSDARARRHQSTVPVEALRHHADLQAHTHHRGIGVDRGEPHQDPRQPPTTASTTRRPIFAHHGARRRRRRIADLRICHSPESCRARFCRSGPWGFKSGSGCGTVTAIVNRTRLGNLRDLHRREVACERHWRIRRGMTPVSGVAHAANRPTAATPSTPADPAHGRPCKSSARDALKHCPNETIGGNAGSALSAHREGDTGVPRSSAAALRRAGMTSSARRWRVGRSSVTRMKVPAPFKSPLGHVVSAFKSYGSKS